MEFTEEDYADIFTEEFDDKLRTFEYLHIGDIYCSLNMRAYVIEELKKVRDKIALDIASGKLREMLLLKNMKTKTPRSPKLLNYDDE